MPIKVVSISTDSVIGLDKISEDNILELEYVAEGSFVSNYEGSYDFTPSTYDQIAPTKSKILNDDIVIKATPYAEVSNPSGGYTVTIL